MKFNHVARRMKSAAFAGVVIPLASKVSWGEYARRGPVVHRATRVYKRLCKRGI